MKNNKYPQFIMEVLAQTKSGGGTVLEIEISCSQWERAQHALKVPQFFSLSFGVGVGEDSFHYSFVPNMFPSSSQWEPIRFPMCSQYQLA
jgi:hypothetical protein